MCRSPRLVCLATLGPKPQPGFARSVPDDAGQGGAAPRGARHGHSLMAVEIDMNSNTLAALVFATGLWIGLGAWAVGGGSTRPNGEFWTSTSSAKIASHPTLVRGSYPRQARTVDRAVVAAATD